MTTRLSVRLPKMPMQEPSHEIDDTTVVGVVVGAGVSRGVTMVSRACPCEVHTAAQGVWGVGGVSPSTKRQKVDIYRCLAGSNRQKCVANKKVAQAKKLVLFGDIHVLAVAHSCGSQATRSP